MSLLPGGKRGALLAIKAEVGSARFAGEAAISFRAVFELWSACYQARGIWFLGKVDSPKNQVSTA